MVNKDKIKKGARLILEGIGEDPSRQSIIETWERRVPEMYETLSEGYRDENKPSMKDFKTQNKNIVIKTDIPIYSLCEHHLLPYFGIINIAYKPRNNVVGLSKLARYIRWKSRRITMQEELTSDIAEGLRDETGAEYVLVTIEATHLCECMRGIEQESQTRTIATSGTSPDDKDQILHTVIGNREGSLIERSQPSPPIHKIPLSILYEYSNTIP